MATVVFTNDNGLGPTWGIGTPNRAVFEEIAALSAHAMPMLKQAAQVFVNTASDIYEKVTYSEAVRKSKAIMNTIANMGMQDTVQVLASLGQLQQARPVMQQFIMANPIIRQMYHEQRIDGYATAATPYRDVYPTHTGESHYAYRRVMDGIWHEDVANRMVCDQYHEMTHDDDLSIEEQAMVHETWDYALAAIKRGKEDPTSVDNEML